MEDAEPAARYVRVECKSSRQLEILQPTIMQGCIEFGGKHIACRVAART
jgi:hypothetical protein